MSAYHKQYNLFAINTESSREYSASNFVECFYRDDVAPDSKIQIKNNDYGVCACECVSKH